MDLLTLSAHKLGGPQGVGALVVRDGLELTAYNDWAAARSFADEAVRRMCRELQVLALLLAKRRLSTWQKPTSYSRVARCTLQAKLLESDPQIHIFSGEADRLPNTLCFAHPEMPADMLLIGFDLEGVAVSSGSACSSGKVEKSPVLAAMGIEDPLASGAIRVSLGWNSNVRDVEQFAHAWTKITARHKARKAA